MIWNKKSIVLILLHLSVGATAFLPAPSRPYRDHNALLLKVVADPPIEKENGKSKGRKKNDDDSNDWIASKDGGFIPNIRARLRGPSTTKTTIQEVTDIQQYKTHVAEINDQMVCVRFYAPWCRACKAVESSFRRLPRDFPNVKFVECPVTKDNAYLHQGLGVPSLPFAHLYHPQAGLVEERKINKHVFGEFKGILQTYVDGECPITEDDDDDDDDKEQ